MNIALVLWGRRDGAKAAGFFKRREESLKGDSDRDHTDLAPTQQMI